MSPFADSRSDKITLITTGRLPERCIVPRSRLIFHSSVFRDLLSLPTTAEDARKQEISLTETAVEVKGLFMILQDEEEKLSSLRFDDWFKLVRMADKYDCKAATRELLSRVW